MSLRAIALLLSLGTSICWGMITPLAVQMQRSLGLSYHPLHPMIWNVLGGNVILVASLLIAGPAPFRSLSWSWWGVMVGIVWPLGGILLMIAVMKVPGIASLLNAIGAAYPVLISLPLLFFFLGESVSLLRALFLVGAAFCLFLAAIVK